MSRVRRILVSASLLLAITATAQDTTPAAVSFRISGFVLDSTSGQPVAGAQVVIAPVVERGSIKRALSAADGAFTFDGLSKGKYSLGAEHRGYPGQGYDQHEGYATAIAVGPGLDSEHIVFRLRPAGGIRGTVTSEDNEPIGGATVRLFGSGIANGEATTRELMTVTTDDRGLYSFAHLADHEYYIAVSGRPWYANVYPYLAITYPDPLEAARMKEERSRVDRVYPLTFYPGTFSADQARPIRVPPGEKVTADIVLQSARNIHVRISAPVTPGSAKESENLVISDMHRKISFPPRVMFYKNVFGTLTNIESAMTSTADDGVYEFSGMPAGHYTMTLHRGEGLRPEGGGITQEVDLEDGVELTVGGGTSSASVSGVLSIDGQVSRERAIVRLVGKGIPMAFATEVKDGKFEFMQSVPPGTYEVGLAGNANDQYIKIVTATGARISGRALQVSSGAAIKLAITAATGMGRVDGVALDHGKPLAGAMIVLVPADIAHNATLVRRDQSDSDGTFTLPQVVPGTYRVIAIQNGWKLPWSDPKVLNPYLGKATTYSITGGNKLEVKVEVQTAK